MKKSIFALAIALCSSSSYAAGWEKYHEDQSTVYYVDFSTHKVGTKDKNLHQYWHMMEFRRPDSKKVKYIKTLVQHDCGDDTTRVASVVALDSKQAVLMKDGLTSVEKWPWEPVSPGSIVGMRHNALCSR
jgi:hypothetical protein